MNIIIIFIILYLTSGNLPVCVQLNHTEVGQVKVHQLLSHAAKHPGTETILKYEWQNLV